MKRKAPKKKTEKEIEKKKASKIKEIKDFMLDLENEKVKEKKKKILIIMKF